ncbi:UNVERIFIED_CONTAM: hypothetical protein HDU68_005608, partial [Siphonaria sp. JEL0065]
PQIKATGNTAKLLTVYAKELKMLSKNASMANDEDLYEEYDDEMDVKNVNVRETFRHLLKTKTLVVSPLSRLHNTENCIVWDQFGTFWMNSVAKFIKSKNLALMMHVVGSYGKGFKRMHVSNIVHTIREKAPNLLREGKKLDAGEVGLFQRANADCQDGQLTWRGSVAESINSDGNK